MTDLTSQFLKNFGTRFNLEEKLVENLIHNIVTLGGYEKTTDLLFIRIEEWKILGLPAVLYSKLVHFFAENGLRRKTVIPYGLASTSTSAAASSSSSTATAKFEVRGQVSGCKALIDALSLACPSAQVAAASDDKLVTASGQVLTGLPTILRFLARENGMAYYSNITGIENVFQVFLDALAQDSSTAPAVLEAKYPAIKDKKWVVDNQPSIADLLLYGFFKNVPSPSAAAKDWVQFATSTEFTPTPVAAPKAQEKKQQNQPQEKKQQNQPQEKKQQNQPQEKKQQNQPQEKKQQNQPQEKKQQNQPQEKKQQNQPQEKKQQNQPQEKKQQNQPQEKKQQNKKAAPAAAPVSISRMLFKVGKIIEVKKHTEHLYVEKIDVGEEKPRTVLSGLVEFIPESEMLGKELIVVANLKPRPMQGITSEGMVLCASNSDHTVVEFIDPPKGSKIGERVWCEGFEGEPDLPFCNPKKKVFETLQPDLKTNEKKVACWKKVPLRTSAGECTSKTLANATIR